MRTLDILQRHLFSSSFDAYAKAWQRTFNCQMLKSCMTENDDQRQ